MQNCRRRDGQIKNEIGRRRAGAGVNPGATSGWYRMFRYRIRGQMVQV